jgi:phage terminase small subunit
MSQADAYRSAYNTKRMADKTIHENASRLANDSKISARISELRGQLAKETIMSAQERLEYLTRIVRGDEKEIVPNIVNGEVFEVEVPVSIKTRIDAIDKMNKMTGEYVQKVQAEVTSYENNLKQVVDEDEY